ncbi:hypothetical protein FA13DRAFT_1735161 [Coprinellus micaceus]|uniref:Uncharacterized protein n=1 Tax=Coprinellus micaceus TaxID=71717 RepID=A0A4Y7T668_COPMI|nr:hypothetical protein FA13DRAFT_1735161 [Coprinellus micaceus]
MPEAAMFSLIAVTSVSPPVPTAVQKQNTLDWSSRARTHWAGFFSSSFFTFPPHTYEHQPRNCPSAKGTKRP